MGKIKKNHSIKLITGLIYKDRPFFLKILAALERHFGTIDFESQPIAFTYTDYYQKEFGSGLTRSFISFKKLIPAENLPEIKIFTNKLENRFIRNGKRTINIDPGYLDLAKLVLATTKDYYHRIYLSKGIFAEITLVYQNHTFRAQPWTYPDYQSQEYINIFNQIRELYRNTLKKPETGTDFIIK